MNWRPIETAPMDGTNILVTDGEITQLGWHDEFDEPDDPWCGYIKRPTHWMPLPDPPKNGNGDGPEAADGIEHLRAREAMLRKALATYACRCGDGECYVEEFVPSCGRSAREALGLILDANSLNYAQEIAAKALEEKK